MGKYNSSTYRIRPLMELIESDYDAFLSLLSLVGISPLSKPNTYKYQGVACDEMKLKPTKQHLKSLLKWIFEKQHKGLKVNGQNRMDLFYGSAESRKMAFSRAMEELELNYDTITSNKIPWYMFEGFTSPDIFIEGDDYVIVCEGKWTEPSITTTTKYLASEGEYRNQMIRHIQGALNYTTKRVYAFYIVDKECGYKNELDKESFIQQIELETIKMDEKEKKEVLKSFYGFTTWQDIKSKLPKIVFKDKKSIK